MPNYRRGVYDFTIDSSFQPFSMQEMLVPFTAYKEAFEKSEEAYNDLKTKADVFKDLSSSLPEGSKARQIYEGYANDLNAQAADLANNGLTMGNRRALTGLKQRYQGEIGRLAKAQTALEKVKELRRQMNAKDPTMIWASENFNIDDYLDNNTPNLYGISGTDLYTKAAAAAQGFSKRAFNVNGDNKTLGGYYRDFVQRMGYTPEELRRFGEQISNDFSAWASSNIPELALAANQILEANGAAENLQNNPNGLRRAQQQIVRGLIDGAVYTENHNPVRDPGVPSWTEQRNDARAEASLAMQKEAIDFERQVSGWKKNTDGTWYYDPNADVKTDAEVKKAAAIAAAKGTGKTGTSSKSSSGGGKGGSTEHKTQGKDRLLFTWSGDPEKNPDSAPKVEAVADDATEHNGEYLSYEELPEHAKKIALKRIGRGKVSYYDYYYEGYNDNWGPWNRQAKLEIVPRNIVTDDKINLDDIDEDSELE